MFTKILIANRGEIACRIATTARRMGMQTVAVYSQADCNARHVALCDEAVAIGASPARDSYLCMDKLIRAALATGAQAIHPGYGFLSENAAFAQACADAGLCFIGPPVAAIVAMGSKSSAKTLMEHAGVPLVPGFHGQNQDPDFLRQQADRIGYPVLLKASAGGGGKGMRIVEAPEDFLAALASCKREASSSFGDEQVLIEKYLMQPRHIEFQIFADQHGNCVHLFERDCSVQRRHQKVLEEAPAPGMTAVRRQAMGAAATAAARAVGYVGAGTVEFIVDAEETFYFMEMNTRLQVEHPVTEMITGQDLVEWQMRVAAGEEVPLRQTQLSIHGHALEARIYAENPDNDFLPATGILSHVRWPHGVMFAVGAQEGEPAPVRIDSGIREGDTVSPFYDPMLAKLIVWGRDRPQALARMGAALAQLQLVGLHVNVGFLQRLVASVPFVTAALDTGLIARHQAALLPAPVPAGMPVLALACMGLLDAEATAVRTGKVVSEPWAQPSGWRMNLTLQRRLTWSEHGQPVPLLLTYHPASWLLAHANATGEPAVVRLEQHQDKAFTLNVDGQRVCGTVVLDGVAVHVFYAGQHSVLLYDDALAHTGQAEVEAGRLTAPMPGKIVAIMVKPHDPVKKGVPLLIMEAMKMEHTILAPRDGVVETVLYAVGDQVEEGVPLLAFMPPSAKSLLVTR